MNSNIIQRRMDVSSVQNDSEIKCTFNTIREGGMQIKLN